MKKSIFKLLFAVEFSGQPIFLHAVNVQMMVRQFGAFENCPKVIRGKIVEKDSASMTSGKGDRHC
jgi:hypothetical protein